MGRSPAAGVGLSTSLATGHPDLARFIGVVVAGDRVTFDDLLAANPQLATARVTAGATRGQAEDYFFDDGAKFVEVAGDYYVEGDVAGTLWRFPVASVSAVAVRGGDGG